MTIESPPSVTDAIDSVLDALDKARALLGVALLAEQAKTGASADELAERAARCPAPWSSKPSAQRLTG
ncbi:hypothetical protein AB0392_39675 [Nonomuraea angiospora]|uniref:hypothetical protein n=1 Tax=Nonomuraea angiospora TaxID=46172 RepID=UPI00344D02E3